MLGYAYDPRLVKVEDAYHIIWCTDFFGAAIGMAVAGDFKTFISLEKPFIPFNRNAVPLSRRIKDTCRMLSRPSDGGHTPLGTSLSRKARTGSFGKALPCDELRERLVGERFDRRRRGADRNDGGLAAVLLRCLKRMQQRERVGYAGSVVFSNGEISAGTGGSITTTPPPAPGCTWPGPM